MRRVQTDGDITTGASAAESAANGGRTCPITSVLHLSVVQGSAAIMHRRALWNLYKGIMVLLLPVITDHYYHHN